MIDSRYVAMLALPPHSRVDRRVPKKLLIEHGAATAADKRYITEGIEEIRWLAALKPETTGVQAYRDADRDYSEIAVLSMNLRAGAKATRLMELLHRAIPYPVLLLTDLEAMAMLSVAHKRRAQNETDKVVLDGELQSVTLNEKRDADWIGSFCGALAFDHQPRSTLRTVYQGWMDALTAAQAAQLTGTFRLVDAATQSQERRDALRVCAQLKAEIAKLRVAADKERQMPKLVELNNGLKQLEAEYAATMERLK